jgi:uncharacterized protein YciI
MNFVVIGKDGPSSEARMRHRPAHLDFMATHQAPVVYAGPLLEARRMVGSIFVFDIADRKALDAHLAADPYFAEGIFESVEIYESRWMVPEREPGVLAAEAKRARDAAPAA